jgi:hypothetical protein
MAGRFWGEFDNVGPILFSPGAGLLVYQPWLGLILLLPILCVVNHQSELRERNIPSGWTWVCASILVMQVALVAKWIEWWGGACWGSRLCTDAIPFAALLCLKPIAYLRERRWGLALIVALAITASFIHVYLACFQERFELQVETLMNWSNAPFFPKI